jgi:hypothetical protein
MGAEPASTKNILQIGDGFKIDTLDFGAHAR